MSGHMSRSIPDNVDGEGGGGGSATAIVGDTQETDMSRSIPNNVDGEGGGGGSATAIAGYTQETDMFRTIPDNADSEGDGGGSATSIVGDTQETDMSRSIPNNVDGEGDGGGSATSIIGDAEEIDLSRQITDNANSAVDVALATNSRRREATAEVSNKNLSTGQNINDTVLSNKPGTQSERFCNMKYLAEHKLNRLNYNTYVKTRAHNKAETLLDDLGVVILVGSPGSGKSTLGLHVMAHVKNTMKRQVLLLQHPSQFEDISIPPSMVNIEQEEKLVIMIDDIFGRTNLIGEYEQKWELNFTSLWEMVKTGFMKVIITFRTQIFSQCEIKLRDFDVFKTCHQINLHATDFCLTDEEKRSILLQHLKTSKIVNSTLSEEDVNDIIQLSSTELGFPQCCRFYVNSLDAQKRGLGYFLNPIEYLKRELDKMKSDMQCQFQYLVLLIVMFKQGTLNEDCLDPFEEDKDTLNLIKILKNVCQINTDVSLGEIKSSAMSLSGVYLEFDQRYKAYSFIHQSVFDTLFLQFSKEYLKQSIKICPLSVMLEYVVTPHAPTRGAVIVMVEKENYRLLAQRFTSLLKETQDIPTVRRILSHQSFNDEEFVKFLTEIFWKEELLSEILYQKLDILEPKIATFFNQQNVDELWENVENGQIDDIDVCDCIFFTKPEHCCSALPTMSTPAAVVVFENLKTLSTCFAINICKGNINETVHQQQEILDIGCLVGNNEVVDIMLTSGITPTMSTFTSAAASSSDNEKIFASLLKHKKDLELSLKDLGSLLCLSLDHENGQISNLLIDEITNMDSHQIILERAVKQLLLQCNGGAMLLLNSITHKNSFKMRAGNLFRKLSRYTVSIKRDFLVSLVAAFDDASALKDILLDNPSWLDTMKETTSPLQVASCYGCVDSVAFLIEQGCNLYTTNLQQKTALHLAAKYNTTDVVQCLLSKGADPNVQDINENSSLHLACQNDSALELKMNQKRVCLDSVKELVKNGAKLNVINALGETPLHLASRNTSIEIIKFLVEKGSEVNIQDINGMIPLHLAVINEMSLECVKYLIDKESKVNTVDDDGFTPLFFASRADVASYLIHNGADAAVTSKDKDTVLHMVIRRSSRIRRNSLAKIADFIRKSSRINVRRDSTANILELAKLFVENGVDVNMQNIHGETPLHIAAKSKLLEIVRYLVEQGSQVNLLNREGRSPLYVAMSNLSFSRHSDVSLYLLQKGADTNLTNKENKSLLQLALKARSLQLTKVLVEKGATLNTFDAQEMIPLHVAVKNNAVEFVKCLVENGANVNIKKEGMTALHLAVTNKKFDVCTYLLHKGADPNVTDAEQNSPLHLAVYTNSLDVVKLLIEKGAMMNAVNTFGKTALHIARETCSVDIMKFLIQSWCDVGVYLLNSGAKPNIADSTNISLLQLAVCTNKLELAKELIKNGAKPNIVDSCGNTLLHIAAYYSSADMVGYLVEIGLQIYLKNDKDMMPLHLAAIHNTSDVCLSLLDKGADPNVSNAIKRSPLHLAIRNKDLKVVETLIQQGSKLNNVDKYGNTPLHIAAKEGSLETVRYLIQMGSKVNLVNYDNVSPFNLAVEYRTEDVSIYLLDKSSEPNLVGNPHMDSPLHWALKKHSLCLAKVLLKRGSNVNEKNKYGQTALQSIMNVSASFGEYAGMIYIADTDSFEYVIDYVRLLVENGSDINTPDKNGTTPLHEAVRNDLLDVSVYLLQNGADPKAKDSKKITPLHVAAENGSLQLLKTLVKQGANVNETDSLGDIPLHMAAERKSEECIRYLVHMGSHVNKTNKKGITPLHIAAQDQNSNIGLYLLVKGADPNITNAQKSSSLHLAAAANCLDLVKVMVEKGADLNAVDNTGETVLHKAASYGSFELVCYLVQKGSNINVKNATGRTPLHLASVDYLSTRWTVRTFTSKVGKYLLQKGSVCNAIDTSMATPLHLAVCNKYLALVELLVEHGATLGSVDRFGNTPLHIAAQYSSLEIVRYLLNKGSQVNLENASKMLPFDMALQYNTLDVSVYLLQETCDTIIGNDIKMNSLLNTAVKKCYLELAKVLVEWGVNVNSADGYGMTPLHTAVEKRSLELVSYLVEKEAKVNASDQSKITPLHIAVKNNSMELVTYLIQKGATVNVTTRENITPLYIAVEQNNTETSLYLLSKEADPNVSCTTSKVSPLHLAAKEHCFELVKALVERKANVNAVDIDGNMPLHTTIDSSGRTANSSSVFQKDNVADIEAMKCVRYFVDSISEINTANSSGATPLHLALKRKMFAVSLYLLSKGADPNVTDKKNISPLHLAAEKCSLELLEKLVEKGANMNATDGHGNIPLHFGVSNNSIQIVMYLVEKGSKINLKNKSFVTPLHEGVRLENPKIAMYLLDKGADPNITNKNGDSPLHMAVDLEHIDLINELVMRGANLKAVDSDGSNPFQRAIYHSSLKVVQCLEEKESMVHIPDILGRTALHLAACGRRLNHPAVMDQIVIRWLLDAGCNINSEDKHGYTPLMYACSSGNCGNVQLLLEKGANPNGRNLTALHIAAGCHMTDILKILLKKVGNQNVVSNFGDTLVHFAVLWDLRTALCRAFYSLKWTQTFWRECIDYLVSDFRYRLKMPERIWRMDICSWPFMLNPMPLPKLENILEVLLDSGCNINAKNNAGRTPVHVCIQYGQCRNLIELLNRGADVSRVDNLGRSALYYAVSLVIPDAVQILVHFGAKDGETNYGVTACEKAHVKMQYSDDENIKAKCSKIINLLNRT